MDMKTPLLLALGCTLLQITAARAYDVAAYVWPSYYSDAPELRWAWPERMGEWERVRQAQPKFPGHKLTGIPLWG